ncbi:LPD7 domain-containing protein [Pelomonas sp. Root1444]|uniref:LPD7 domain-containing protein n=1 Tax=Pelomonas sp. Root1444 TaxID=1736464 RepID=UPI0007026B1E|nr:LPD7 domain-containing protein [Pelomonas sp. Root1444]KQY89361.1 hypothetical protein ASD35_11740 [Pelomonas sp. Root1444]
MDADSSSISPRPPPQGGTVEPAKRAAGAPEKLLEQHNAPGERYELRDPFADVTYRANTMAEMIAKAEQFGSSRFTAIAPDGRRTPVLKSGTDWQRSSEIAGLFKRPQNSPVDRDDVPQGTAAPKIGSGAPAMKPEPMDATAVAKIDAEAERAALVTRLEAALKERYIIKRAPVQIGHVTVGRTEYRFRGDSTRVAFTESNLHLATDTNSPSVARSMVDVAQARDWKGLRVSGSEEFRRMVWLEASVRGVKAVGYEPNAADMDILKREREARLTNRIEPNRDAPSGTASTPAEKSSTRGGGRKALVAAIEAVLVAKGVPETRRNAVLAAATEKLAERASRGQSPKVKVYDMTAASQRPGTASTPEPNRVRDRATPSHAR